MGVEVDQTRQPFMRASGDICDNWAGHAVSDETNVDEIFMEEKVDDILDMVSRSIAVLARCERSPRPVNVGV